MFLLLETIKILNGQPIHLEWHQKRFEKSYFKLFNQYPKLKLNLILNTPNEYKTGTAKLRFIYNRDSFLIKYSNYNKKEIRSLQLVYDDNIYYAIKYLDRSCLDNLLKQKANCDDILIVKNNLITESSYTNIVFFNGTNWVTPVNPLLKGTTRERLLSEKIISEKDIKIKDLKLFKGYKLINAMMDFEEQEFLDIDTIVQDT
jgi:4-amino-4-deoxychorismate lyase